MNLTEREKSVRERIKRHQGKLPAALEPFQQALRCYACRRDFTFHEEMTQMVKTIYWRGQILRFVLCRECIEQAGVDPDHSYRDFARAFGE